MSSTGDKDKWVSPQPDTAGEINFESSDAIHIDGSVVVNRDFEVSGDLVIKGNQTILGSAENWQSSLSFSDSDGAIVMTIDDDGIHISEEYKDKVDEAAQHVLDALGDKITGKMAQMENEICQLNVEIDEHQARQEWVCKNACALNLQCKQSEHELCGVISRALEDF